MKFIKQKLDGVFLIEPQVHLDERGYFFESFRQDEFQAALGFPIKFCQENESRSSYGVLRGLHFQVSPYAQSKLVCVTEGEVLDVSVDLRKGSPTFGQHLAVSLSAKNKLQLFIPRGFAHGFLVLSEFATCRYKVDNYYSFENQRGLAFNDPALGIDWGLPADQLTLSEKDLKQPGLVDLVEGFDINQSLY